MRLYPSSILALILSGLLAIASGCGGSQSSTPSSEAPSSAAPESQDPGSPAGKEKPGEIDNQEDKKGNPEPGDNSSIPCHPLDEKPENWEDPLHSSTFIDSSSLEEHKLRLWVHYSGCQEGTLILHSSRPRAGKKSMPHQISLKMAQAGMCEMLLREQLCLDLSSLPYQGPEYSLILNEGQDTLYYRP